MGPKNVALNHLPHPERYFERRLFGELESRGYDYKSLNEIGVGTLHYDVESIEKNTNLRDWVPEWCFPFIFWAARPRRRQSLGQARLVRRKGHRDRPRHNRRRSAISSTPKACRFPTTTPSPWTLLAQNDKISHECTNEEIFIRAFVAKILGEY